MAGHQNFLALFLLKLGTKKCDFFGRLAKNVGLFWMARFGQDFFWANIRTCRGGGGRETGRELGRSLALVTLRMQFPRYLTTIHRKIAIFYNYPERGFRLPLKINQLLPVPPPNRPDTCCRLSKEGCVLL